MWESLVFVKVPPSSLYLRIPTYALCFPWPLYYSDPIFWHPFLFPIVTNTFDIPTFRMRCPDRETLTQCFTDTHNPDFKSGKTSCWCGRPFPFPFWSFLLAWLGFGEVGGQQFQPYPTVISYRIITQAVYKGTSQYLCDRTYVTTWCNNSPFFE